MDKHKIHYAWVILAGCMLTVFCTVGLAANAFVAYQPYIISENGFTNEQSSMILTVRALITFIGMMSTGWFYKRVSYRKGMAIAVIVTAVAFFCFSISKTYVQYLLSAACIGVGYGLGCMIPGTIVLTRWFKKKRKLAFGIFIAVTGLSTLGIPNLITNSIEKNGLSFTFRVEALVILAGALIVFLIIRDKPEDIGLQPYGEEDANPERKSIIRAGVMDKKGWIIMFPVSVLTGVISTTAISHMSVLAVNAGYTTQLTSTALAVLGLSMIPGKVLYGAIAEKTSGFVSNFVFGTSLALGMVCCCLFNGNPVLLFLGMIFCGMGFSLPTAGLNIWANDLSSTEQKEGVIRRFNAYNGGGNLVFSLIPGIMADRFGGSYKPAYLMFLIITILVLVGVQSMYGRLRKLRRGETYAK